MRNEEQLQGRESWENSAIDIPRYTSRSRFFYLFIFFFSAPSSFFFCLIESLAQVYISTPNLLANLCY